MSVTSKPKIESVIPTTVIAQPPAPNPAPDVSKPIAVPAALDEAQAKAQALIDAIKALCVEFFEGRPRVSTYVAPTQAEIKVRIAKAVADAGVESDDFLAIGTIVAQVKAEIALAEKDAGLDKQAGVDKMYAYAVIGALKGMPDVVRPLIGLEASKKKDRPSPTAGAKRGRKATINTEKLIEWAESMNMPGFILVDAAADGMYGTFHASMARPNGKWERLQYNKDTNQYTRTGTLESTPMWWTNPATGERPAENMRRVLKVRMIDKNGALITTQPHINHNGKEFLVKGDYSVVCKSLGL